MSKHIREMKAKVKKYIFELTEEQRTFILMTLITYLITIAITVLPILIRFDDLNQENCDFYKCIKTSRFLYLTSCIIQTINSTTITFSGTIFVLQSQSDKKKTFRVLLFIGIILLALIAVFQTSIYSEKLLYFTNVVLIIINVFVLYFSKLVFFLPPLIDNYISKREISDCKPIA